MSPSMAMQHPGQGGNPYLGSLGSLPASMQVSLTVWNACSICMCRSLSPLGLLLGCRTSCARP